MFTLCSHTAIDWKRSTAIRAEAFPVLLMYVIGPYNLTHMEKTQVYLEKEELEAVREAAARSGRSMAEVIREAIRKTVLKPRRHGFVAIWDGKAKTSSDDHDSIYDEKP